MAKPELIEGKRYRIKMRGQKEVVTGYFQGVEYTFTSHKNPALDYGCMCIEEKYMRSAKIEEIT